MDVLLTSPLFLYGAFPLGSAVLGIGVKHATRNDRYAKFTKEDLAVGIELMLTAFLMYVLLTTDRAVALREANEALAAALQDSSPAVVQQLQSQSLTLSGQLTTSGWLIAIFFLALWSVSTIVRKWGWKDANELHPLIGIAVPLVFGVLSVVVVAAGAAQ